MARDRDLHDADPDDRRRPAGGLATVPQKYERRVAELFDAAPLGD